MTPWLSTLARLLVAAAALSLAACASAPATRVLPLPRLAPGPVEMRVAHVVNPRLPRLDSARLQLLLEATRKASREHFGIDLEFAEPVEIPIDELFRHIVPEAGLAEQIYDFKSGKGDPARFEKAFVAGLKANGDPAAAVLNFAGPHLAEPVPATYQALGAALARLQLQRIEAWKRVKAVDGGPAIDASPYNEFVLWAALGRAPLPFELVVTNQVIASVEYESPAPHSAIRGGYSNGLTTPNGGARFGTTSVWSTFAFTATDPWVVQMRGGEIYEDDEAARLAGLSAAHEIGHQLLHLGHPFGNPACLMHPVPMFAFGAWMKGLSAGDCTLGSSPAMEAGAVQFLIPGQ